MVLYYHINNNFFLAKSIECNFYRLVIYHILKQINDDYDQVVRPTFSITKKL